MRKILSVILTLSLMLVYTGCKGTDKKLKVGVMTSLDSLPILIADKLGYFEKDIEISIFKSAAERDSALLSDELDGTVSDIPSAATNIDDGLQVSITSAAQGNIALVAGKNSDVFDTSQLKDKSIGISANTGIELIADEILKDNGLNEWKVDKIVVPSITSRLELLQTGQIDLGILPQPFATKAVESGCKILTTTDKLNINLGVILFTNEAINNKSIQIYNFYKGYNKAADWINENDTEEYPDKFLQNSELPDTLFKIHLPKYSHAQAPLEKDFELSMNWCNKKELINSSLSYESLINLNYINNS